MFIGFKIKKEKMVESYSFAIRTVGGRGSIQEKDWLFRSFIIFYTHISPSFVIEYLFYFHF